LDVLAQIRESIDSETDIWRTHPAYYLFEGWDVEDRSRDVLEQAVTDGVDLDSDDLIRCVGPAPHPFQNGYLLSTKKFRGIMAANQLGKSVVVGMEILMSATGEIPIAYRYPKGYDTGVKRLITQENIRRWGRRCKDTGKILDHDTRITSGDDWDCGNVTGCGVFPQEKIVPAGSTIRIGSTQKLLQQNWWPAFTESGGPYLGQFVPRHFIDKARGSFVSRGANKSDKQVFLLRNVTLQMLTYDAGKSGFEGIRCPIYLDEEPKDEAIIGSVVTHALRWSLVETPYYGITYTKGLIFPKKRSPHMETFHATAYDCPYKTEEDIEQDRSTIEDKPWEIGARIYGIPSDLKGEPYYDRRKIGLWMQSYKYPYKLARFEAVEEWNGIVSDDRISRLPGLMDVPVRMVEAQKEDDKAVWRIYEDRLNYTPYMNASDQAEGADVVTDAADASTCVMGRHSDDDPTMPVVAATLRSTLPTPQFATEALLACRYYHNALIIPETGRGAANESFKSVAQDWPYWFKDAVVRQSTRKARVQLGFCPTTDRREVLFNVLLRNWFDSYDEDEYPNIPDEWILREAASAVIGKTAGGMARCDHPPSGTIDSLIAFGIILYGMKIEFLKQMKYHGDTEQQERKLTQLDIALMGKIERDEPSNAYLGDIPNLTRR